MLNVAVFISGSGTNLQALIDDSLQSKDYSIKLVCSNKENAYGLVRAQNNNIPTILTTDSEKLLQVLSKEKIDLIVLAGFLSILKGNIIKKYKIINIHPSLIPAFCGKGMYGENVHQAVIKSGVKFSGCTTHYVNEGIDTGEIIMQSKVSVCKNDTPESIQKKILPLEHKILVETVRKIARGL